MADYNAGQAYLTVLPDMSGFGSKVREELAKDQTQFKVPVKPEVDKTQGSKDGEEYGGAFGDTMRARIEAALKDLPKPKIDADSSEADRKIDEIRTRLEELRDKRIGVDITSAEALSEISAIKADLDELGRKSPNVQVKVDALKAAADLAGIRAEVTALDGKNVDIKVDDGGSASRATGDIHALMLAGISLGPAIIPVAAAVAAALAAIGTGAVLGIAGIGAIKLAFTGISSTIKDMDSVQQSSGKTAAQTAAQQVSSANSIASAQDGVRNAIRSVEDAQRSAAQANQQAAEQVSNAQRSLQDAYIQTGISIQGALQQQAQAEQTLANAQQQEQLAQEALTNARQAAQRQIESLTLAVEDGALAERQAQLNITKAKQALDQTLTNPTATQLQRDQAQLTYDQSVQQLKDIQVRNQQNAQDKAAADAKGVEGSQQVQAAQRGVAQAAQSVANAQQGVANADQNVAETRRKAAETITLAQQGLADAQARQAETARAGAESVTKAQEGVISAERSLQGALAQQAAQQDATSSSANKLAQDMAKLSPAGQEFVHFFHDDLEPKLKGLQATAAQGMLPGVEAGLRAMFPVFPEIDSLVGTVATSIGDLARRAGTALNDPFWRNFITFIRGEAGPSFNILGTILGNLARGGAALLEAFKPIWDQMGLGLEHLTGKFADFATHTDTNSGFQQFIQYVKTEGPVVVKTVGDLLIAFGDIGRALGPLGGVMLVIIDDLARFVAVIPPGWLEIIVTTLWAGYEAWKAWQIISIITKALTEWEIATKLATAAQWLLNIAMDANPIGIVILAIGALIAIVILVATHFDFFKNIVIACWDGIKIAAQSVWDYVLHPIFDAIVIALNAVGNAFLWLWHGAVQLASDGIMGVWNVLKGAWQLVVDAFNFGMNTIQNIWNRLIDIAKIPVNFVIGTVYNQGIVTVWDDIAGIFGLPKLQPAALLAEGGVLPGYSPGRDTVPAVLSPGEGVLVPEAVRGLGADFVYAANAHFSGGRAVPSAGPRFAGGGVVGTLASIVADPVGSIKSLFSGAANAVIPGTGLLHDALVAIPGKVIDAVIAKAKTLVASVGSAFSALFTGSPDLAGWIQTALQLTGTPGTWAGPLSVLIGRESGGNPNAINLTDSNAAAGNPSQGLMQTIPSTFTAYHQAGTSWNITDPVANIAAGINYIKARYGCMLEDVQILTKRGWLKHDQVQPGDETIGYNPTTGRSEWTAVTHVHHYADAPVVRLYNSEWEAVCTPSHRWVSETRKQVPVVRDTFCQVCGDNFPSARGAKHHMRITHGIREARELRLVYEPEFVETANIRQQHMLKLAAPADTTGAVNISDAEAELLGWVCGDGTVRAWRPGGKHRMTLYQAKPVHVLRIRALVADLPHTENVYEPRAEGYLTRHEFQFGTEYTEGLLLRSGYMHQGPEAFVLSLSTSQRSAWLRGVVGAEGHQTRRNGIKGRSDGPGWSITQANGPVLEAMKLAIYLEGHRPSASVLNKGIDGRKPSSTVAAGSSRVAGGFLKQEDAGIRDVWCVTTELGSWTVQDDVGRMFLTGNSIFNVQQANPNLPPKGYDSGGWLPPGLTLAYNGTGQSERVLTGPQYGALSNAAQGAGQPPITVNVYPRAEHSEAAIADMVEHRLGFALRAVT